MAEKSEPVSKPAPRRPHRQSAPLARIGFAVFAIGLLAVAVIMVLFATGSHDLPLWLNLLAMLAPVGFGIGLIGVYRESRASRTVAAAGRAARRDASGATGAAA